MGKQRKSVGVTAKIAEPLTIPNQRASQPISPVSVSSVPAQSNYVKLLRTIEQLGRDLKPFYTGSKICKTMRKVESDLAKACRLVQQCRVEAQTKNTKRPY